MSMSEHSVARRKWSSGDAKIKVQTKDLEIPNEIDPGYEEYLLILQERNRMIKKLKKKDDRTIELERKEQGFSLYVNGANDRLKKGVNKQPHNTARPKSRKTRTAGDGLSRVSHFPTESGDPEGIDRAKTAPEKNQRKNWVVGSVNLKTQKGSKLRIKAPEILTGKYDDDFEDIESSRSYQYESSDDSDFSDEGSCDPLSHSCSGSEEDLEDQVTLSIADVKKLRQSLEMNCSIRESLARQDSLSPTDSEQEGDIPEEEGLEVDMAESPTKNIRRSSSNILKPNDVIVLEFDSKDKQKKNSHGIHAQRHPDSTKESKIEVTRKKPTAKDHKNPHSKDKDSGAAKQPKRLSGSVEHLSVSGKNNFKWKDDSPVVEHASDAKEDKMASSGKFRRSKGSQSAPGKSEHDNGTPLPQLDSSRPYSASNNMSWKDRLKPTPVVGGQLPSGQKGGGEWSNVVDSNINKIVEKVLQLDDKGQRRLLRALADLDSGSVESTKDFGEALSSTNKPLKATVPIKNMVRAPNSNFLEVCLKLMSNWGHPKRIGLTEIQLFDGRGQRIHISPDNVSIHGDRQSLGSPAALFNGKYKTVKERHMWSSEISSKPVEIKICIPDQSEISKIKIWNFNKGMQELGVGVRRLQIVIGGRTAFDDEIDKGCGNQVFDYGKTIILKQGTGTPGRTPDHLTPAIDNVSFDSDSDGLRSPMHSIEGQPARSETRCMNRSHDPNLHLPVVDSLDAENGSPHLEKTKFLGSVPIPIKGSGKAEPRESKGNPKSNHNKKLRKSKMAAKLDGSSEGLQDIQESEGTPPKPSWLMDSQLEKKNSTAVPAWLAVSDSGSSPSNSRPNSQPKYDEDSGILENWPKAGKDHLLTVLDQELLLDKPSSPGRRSRSAKTPESVADLGEDEKYIELAANSDNEQPLEEGPGSSRMRQIESARAQWRQKEQIRLEESWTSLSLFERSHKGRLSMDMEDDALDEYLNTEKTKPAEPTILEEEDVKDVSVSDDFTIPELPMGNELVINIKSTWGDHHYVGLNGIELFTSTGNMPPIQSIRADPSDINILPEYDKDPRVVANLLDGTNRTRDDTHMWLAPFTWGQNHEIFITFQQPVQLAVMRIWNYNKSRIHSFRGAKDVEIKLDGAVIFKGEIARACGGIMGGSEAFGDMILFTTDEDILETVSQYDKTFEADIYADDESDEDVERPKTADDGAEEADQQRPYTSVARGTKTQAKKPEPENLDAPTTGQVLELNFTDTWGDLFYLGLTGLEVAGVNGETIPLTLDMLDAEPRDLHVLPGYETDDRTLDKLINGNNITTSDENMWLIPFTDGESHLLKICFSQPTEVSAIRFWNYNKSPEDTYRGAKTVHITFDGKQISPPDGFLIRKGPGNCFFDFAQEINLAEALQNLDAYSKTSSAMKLTQSLILDEPSQEYETFQMPCGFIYQFHLLSTWGDVYYLGLNGLEFYDKDGNKIDLLGNNISAYPDSVNVLDGVENDVRTPDKLINGINDTQDGSQMWLAPILPGVINRVYVIFDQPMEISMIKIWNYSKTANRGVKDFALLVDDLLVYNGTLSMAKTRGRGILPTVSAPQPYHTILFTNNEVIRRKEKHTIISNQTGDQDVQMCNDRKIVSKYIDPRTAQLGKPVDQAKRPTTSVTGTRKR